MKTLFNSRIEILPEANTLKLHYFKIGITSSVMGIHFSFKKQVTSFKFALDWSTTQYQDQAMYPATLSYYRDLVKQLNDAGINVHVTLFKQEYPQGFQVIPLQCLT